MPWQQQSTVSLAAQPVAAGGPPADESSAVPIAAPFWGVVLAGDAGEGIAGGRVRGRPGVPGYGVSAANGVTRRRSAVPAWLLAKMADTSIANSALPMCCAAQLSTSLRAWYASELASVDVAMEKTCRSGFEFLENDNASAANWAV